VLLGVVFLAALVGKVRSRRAFAAFADSLRSLRLRPGRSIRPVVGAVVPLAVLAIVLDDLVELLHE
jgi:hypothetical protein